MTTKIARFLAAGLLAAACSAQAFDARPDGVTLGLATGNDDTAMAGVGLVWDWDFQRLRRKAELSAHTEFMVNHWRYDAAGGGSQQLTQLVLLPSLRMRLARGQSPWYIELGIGASWMDQRLEAPGKRFSTQWNFYDMLGLGYSFGQEHHHELGARFVHVSNAGIKRPNPGQNFLQLRYVRRF